MKLFFWRGLVALAAVVGISAASHAALDTLEVYGNAADGDGSSFVDNGGDSYSITAGGSDIWGNSDNGAFLHDGMMTSGDFTAIVRTTSFGGPDDLAGEWGRSGVMARANLDANSANVMTTQKSGGGTGMTFHGRNNNGGGTERSGLNGDFPDSAGGAAVNGVPVWMALSRVGEAFVGHWSLDDGAGAPAGWSDAAVRAVSPDLAGDLLLGLAHQSHSLPRRNTANFDNFSVGAADMSLPCMDLSCLPQYDFVEVGPGQSGQDFGVQFVYYDALGDINNVNQAVEVLEGGMGDIFTGSYQLANTADTNGSAGGGYTLSAPKDPYIGAPEGDTNDVVWVYNGVLDVPEDGTYTIGIDGDDGQRVKIEGADFTFVSGGGEVPLGNPDVLQFAGNTGNAFSTASTFLSAGKHRIQYIGYERGGGAFGELFSFKGELPASGPVSWLPVNAQTSIEDVTIKQPVVLTTDARVINGESIGDIGAEDAINRTRASIDAALADFANSPSGGYEVLDIAEGDMPNGGGDNYTTGVFGEFAVVDTDGMPGETLTFILRTDDGSQMRIVGHDFEAVGGDERAALVDVDGDMALTAEFPTGNTNALGLITLDEGVYAFEALQYEGGGGSNFRLSVASGDQTAAGFSDLLFFPVRTTLEDKFVQGNMSLDLMVPEPSSALLASLGLLGLLGFRRRK